MLSTIVPIIALFSSQVLAHGTVKSIVANGKTYQGYSSDFKYQKNPPAVVGWTADVEDQGPIMGNQVNQPNIICHKDATNAKLSAEVAAGTKVKLNWTPWPNSHKGPVMDYLADCGGDCSTVDKTKLKFFKIDGVGMTGLSGNPPQFADDDMIKAGNSWEVTIPATLKPGNYVLRHETIALHESQKVGGAQLYPQCFNLKVTGSGTISPPGVLGTQIYKQDEPGVVFDIYKKFKATSDYPVPGPAIWNGATAGVAAPIQAAAAAVPSVVAYPSTPSSTATPPRTGGTYAEGGKPAAAASPSAAASPATGYVDAAPNPQASAAPKTHKKNIAKCDKKRHHARDIKL